MTGISPSRLADRAVSAKSDEPGDRGRSSMAERQLPKLHTRVRFPSPAPKFVDVAYPRAAIMLPAVVSRGIAAPFHANAALPMLQPSVTMHPPAANMGNRP